MHALHVMVVLWASTLATAGLSIFPYADHVQNNGTTDGRRPANVSASVTPSTTTPSTASSTASSTTTQRPPVGTTPTPTPTPAPSTSTSTSPSTSPASADDTTPEEEMWTTTTQSPEEKDCQEQIGTIMNGVPINTMRKYDVEKILEENGGAPGKVNVTWNKDVPEFPVEDPKEVPLQDTDNGTYWIYDYRKTDYKTFVRLEHALLRNKGRRDEYVDVRGQIYWTPPDFCNKSRHAYYRKDHEGFKADVTLEYCNLSAESLWCAFPASCQSNATYMACVAAPSSALLASLVG